MSKAILVIDMPENCYKCTYCNGKQDKYPSCALTNYAEGTSSMTIEDIHNKRQSWCPLRKLPERMEVCGTYHQPDKMPPSYKIGFNACIEAIEGRK